MCSSDLPHIQQHFVRQNVVNFIMSEVSLEYHVWLQQTEAGMRKARIAPADCFTDGGRAGSRKGSVQLNTDGAPAGGHDSSSTSFSLSRFAPGRVVHSGLGTWGGLRSGLPGDSDASDPNSAPGGAISELGHERRAARRFDVSAPLYRRPDTTQTFPP